jgi:hypothetical protein
MIYEDYMKEILRAKLLSSCEWIPGKKVMPHDSTCTTFTELQKKLDI